MLGSSQAEVSSLFSLRQLRPRLAKAKAGLRKRLRWFCSRICASCGCSSASPRERSPRLMRDGAARQRQRVKRRNSQFGIFLGHGSEGEHEASVGAEQSAVSHRGDGAASRRPPARAKESGLQSLMGLFHQNHNSAGGQGEITGEYLQKAFQRGNIKLLRTRKSDLRSCVL